jgi:hypothetical protein
MAHDTDQIFVLLKSITGLPAYQIKNDCHKSMLVVPNLILKVVQKSEKKRKTDIIKSL